MLNFHPLQGDLCFYATFLHLLNFFFSWCRLCIPLSCNAARQIYVYIWNCYPNGNELLPCCCKAWRSVVYPCSSLEVLPCRSLSRYKLFLVCTLYYLPPDILSLFLKTQRFSVNDLVMSETTLDGWCQLYISKRTFRLQELKAMKKNQKSLIPVQFV